MVEFMTLIEEDILCEYSLFYLRQKCYTENKQLSVVNLKKTHQEQTQFYMKLYIQNDLLQSIIN